MQRLLIHWVSPVAAVVLWLPVVWRVTVVAVAVGYVAAWAVVTAGQKYCLRMGERADLSQKQMRKGLLAHVLVPCLSPQLVCSTAAVAAVLVYGHRLFEAIGLEMVALGHLRQSDAAAAFGTSAHDDAAVVVGCPLGMTVVMLSQNCN
jgi:hypothetical protein